MFEMDCTIFPTSLGIHQHNLEHIKLLNTTCNHVITITILNVMFLHVADINKSIT